MHTIKTNNQYTYIIYTVPKSKIESMAHYTPEPAQGSCLIDFSAHLANSCCRWTNATHCLACSVSMILTHSGWITMWPWIGSLNTWIHITLADWVNVLQSVRSHPTHVRSFQKRYSRPIFGLSTEKKIKHRESKHASITKYTETQNKHTKVKPALVAFVQELQTHQRKTGETDCWEIWTHNDCTSMWTRIHVRSLNTWVHFTQTANSWQTEFSTPITKCFCHTKRDPNAGNSHITISSAENQDVDHRNPWHRLWKKDPTTERKNGTNCSKCRKLTTTVG